MAPCPIRSVSKLEENCPAVLSSNPNSLLMPQSYMQKMFMPETPMQKKAKVGKNFDAKSKELLFRIWSSRDQKIVQAQRALNVSEIIFQVPSEVSDYDVMRLVSEDLVKNKGNRRVAFTERGKVALGLQIMSEPSEFNKKRTRDKFVFSQIAVPTKPLDESGAMAKFVELFGPDALNDPSMQQHLKQMKLQKAKELNVQNPDQTVEKTPEEIQAEIEANQGYVDHVQKEGWTPQ